MDIKIAEYNNVTIGMFASGISDQESPGEALNNGTLGYGFEVNPDRQRGIFTDFEQILRIKHGKWLFLVINTISYNTDSGILIELFS